MIFSVNGVISFLIASIASVYVIILFLRFFLQWYRVNSHNPLSQSVVKFTDPIIKPLQRIIPDVANIACGVIIVLFLLETIKLSLLFFLEQKHFPDLLELGSSTLASLIYQLLNFFLYAILIRVILSWFVSNTPQSILNVLYVMTEPLLRPIRDRIPRIFGLDISPSLAVIGLFLVASIIVQPFITLIQS